MARREGLVHAEQGISILDALDHKRAGEPLGALSGVTVWGEALPALESIDFDLLAEVSQSPMSDGEPGLSHMRAALRRGAAVATSNKWPVALAGVELTELAREAGAAFRAESSVMSGTPVLAALTGGLGGARPLRLRGVLNATVNFICSRLAAGNTYESALAEAMDAGLAEPDPSADVDGYDSVAKLMVVSALVFDTQLAVDGVRMRGVSALDQAEIAAALGRGERVREVATLDPGAKIASVEAQAVASDDPFFAVDGTTNAIRLEVDPLGEVAITGPGAGPQLAGQGVYSDVIALAREIAARKRTQTGD
jgi:homoserine dehydrogenase